MNLERLETLAQYLEAGAPEVLFSMEHALNPLVDLEETWMDHLLRAQDKEESGCGSVCCMGGAALLMAFAPKDQMFPSFKKQDELQQTYPDWIDVQMIAADYLGLPLDPDDKEFFRVDLFNPELAPVDCTPAQAAEAVRRVMAGEPAWPWPETA